MSCCPFMAISTVQAVPNSGVASCTGSHLGKVEGHRSFLSPHCYGLGFLSSSASTSAAWDSPFPQGAACVMRTKRRANLHVDSFHPTASSSPIPPPHLESPTSPLPRVQSHHPPFLSPIFVPSRPQKVPWQKSLGTSRFWFCFSMWTNLIPNLAVHQNCMTFVKSIASCTLSILWFWKLDQVFCPKQALQMFLMHSQVWEHWCQIFLGTIFKVCAWSPQGIVNTSSSPHLRTVAVWGTL